MRRRYAVPGREETSRAFDVVSRDQTPTWQESFNVAPGATIPVIVADSKGSRRVVLARWGLIPEWWRGPGVPKNTYEVDLADAPARGALWRVPLREHRCLFAAKGWYEWKVVRETGPGGFIREPYFFHHSSGGLVALAGVMSSWSDELGDGNPVISAAMIEGPPPRGASKIAKRMPLPLDRAVWSDWLSSKPLDPATVASMAMRVALDIEHHRVSHRLYYLRHADESVCEPFEPQE